MKKIILSLSVLMSICGTTDSFGSTSKKKSHNETKSTITVVNHGSSVRGDSHCTCKNCVETNKKKHSGTQVVGGYTKQRNLTKEDKQIFKKTYKGKDKLTPLSVSTQVVNGTNYRFVCKDKHGRYVTVVIYKSLSHQGGKSTVVSINR